VIQQALKKYFPHKTTIRTDKVGSLPVQTIRKVHYNPTMYCRLKYNKLNYTNDIRRINKHLNDTVPWWQNMVILAYYYHIWIFTTVSMVLIMIAQCNSRNTFLQFYCAVTIYNIFSYCSILHYAYTWISVRFSNISSDCYLILSNFTEFKSVAKLTKSYAKSPPAPERTVGRSRCAPPGL